jgi:hypothetical protein
MFFGGKGRAESFRQEELPLLLNTLFDAKLGSLRDRAMESAEELRRAQAQFISACDRFEKIEAEPDTEDLYVFNISFVKSQKAPYAIAERRVMESLVTEPKGALTFYDYCKAIADESERVTKEVLKTNATFKQVVQCYSNHIVDLKKSLSVIEKISGSLKAELERRSDEIADYRNVKDSVSRLERLSESIAVTRARIEELKKAPASSSGNGEEAAGSAFESKRAELSKLESEASALKNSIMQLLAPLDRAAKKFDYASARKRQLHVLIEDPESSVKSEADYGEFKEMIAELAKALDEGRIDVKNSKEAARDSRRVLESNVYFQILSLLSLNSRIREASEQARDLEVRLKTAKDVKHTAEMRRKEIEELGNKARDDERVLITERHAVEKLFLDRYGKRIEIRA